MVLWPEMNSAEKKPEQEKGKSRLQRERERESGESLDVILTGFRKTGDFGLNSGMPICAYHTASGGLRTAEPHNREPRPDDSAPT